MSADIATTRLSTQHVAGTTHTSASNLVAWMGAMQAQDPAMAKWAVGIRLPGSTEQAINDAIDKGEIIRTHLLRPTWHYVAPDDLSWMLELTAPHVRSAMRASDKELGLTDQVYSKSHHIMEKSLEGGLHLTREELMTEIRKSGIDTSQYRSGHLLMRAELDGLVCSGANKGKNFTYCLLAERVTGQKKLQREEALEQLARRYFTSHGPATLKDFTWWSGLPTRDAARALEMIKPGLVAVKAGTETCWLAGEPVEATGHAVHLLPAFDEFIISYKDRSATLLRENHSKAVSSNGIFRPVLVVNGQVTGLWKRTVKKDQVFIETSFFEPHSPAIKKLIEQKADRYGDFLGKKAVVDFE